MKLDCPACGARAITPLRKYFTGPARSFPCPGCGVRLSVPARETYLTTAPLLVSLVLAFGGSAPWWVVAIALVVTTVLFLGWVHIIRRD